ncbi:MAG: Hsp20/alpha crystallin family protein [Balneolaceae bacterium]
MSNFTIDIEKQINKLGKDIQQFFEKVTPVSAAEGSFYPDCDIIESSGKYKLLIDVPGLSKKQIKITLKNRVITVSGERELYLEDDETLRRSERSQGSFSRSFALPEDVDTESVSASCKDGVLGVELKKKSTETDDDAQSIPIK